MGIQKRYLPGSGSTLRAKSGLVSVLSGTIAGLLIATASAATVYWDVNGVTAGSGNADGTWDAVTALWGDATGTGTTAIWAAGDIAAFAAGTDFIGTRIVTVSGAQALSGILIDGAVTNLTLTGGTLDFGSGSGSLDTSAWGIGIGKSLIISSVLAGTGGLTISGSLTLSGVNTYSGATSITQGTVKLGNANGLGTSSLVSVSSGATLDLAGLAGGRPVSIAGAGVAGVGALYNSSTSTGASIGNVTLAGNATASSAVAGADTAKVFGLGTLTLNGNKLTIAGGAFSVGIRDITSGDIDINNGGTLYSQNGGSQTSATGTITINTGGRMETRDTDNTAMTSVQTIALKGGTLSTATITGNNGGGAGTTLKNNITVDATSGGILDGNNTGFGIYLRLAGSVSGSGALTLQGAKGIEFQGDTSGYTGTATATNGTISFNPTATSQTFGGILAGSRPVVKSGTNTTIFAGANTYTGATTVSAGTLVLSGANTGNSAFTLAAGTTLKLDYSSQNNSKLHDSSILTINGGTVDLSGGSHTEIVASTSLTGVNSITSSVAGSVLRLNTITRSGGATINFGAGSIAQTDNLNVGTTGILGAWATVGGVDWAVNSTNAGDGLVTAYSGYTLTSVALDAPASYAGAHISVDSNQTPTGAFTANSLRFNNSGANTLTLTGNNTLNNGAILVTSTVGNNASTITGGNLQGPSGGDLFINQANTLNSLTIGSAIQNSTSASTLTKGGAGTLILTGTNTYTGATTIGSGTLRVGGAGTLGAGTYAGNVANNSALQYSSSSNQTLSGNISGTGTLTKDTSASTLILNGVNTYTGLTTVSAGTLQIGNGANNTATLGTNTTSVGSGATLTFYRNGAYTINNGLTGAGTVSFLGTGVSGQSDYSLGGTNTGFTGTMAVNSGARLQIDAANDVGTAALISVASGGQAWVSAGTIARPFNINGNGWTESAGQLGAIRFSGGGIISGGITLAGNSRLTANTGGDTGTISGIITDGASIFGITKTGAGTLTLTNANTYDGGTTLSSGILQVQNAASLGTGTVTIGDANTSTSTTALYIDTNRVSFNKPIVVSSNGSGTVTLGSRATVTGTGIQGFTGGITLNRDVIFDSNAADRTDYNSISGTGNITVTGVGRTVFQSNSSYVGNLSISVGVGGTLQIGAATAGNQDYIPDTTNVTVNDTASNTLAEFRISVGGETIGALNGNGTIDVNAINGTLTVGGGNGTGSFTGVMQNNGNTLAFSKIGSGTQTLTGLNTYTGATTVAAGTLLLDYATNNTGVLASTSALTLSGGTLNLKGKTGTFTTTQTLASLSLTAATGSNIVLNPNSGTSTVLTITSNTLTTGAGSSVNFNYTLGTSNGSTAGNNYVAWNPTLTGGIIGGSYTVTDTGGAGYATVIGGKVLRYVDPGSAGLPLATGASTGNYFNNSSYNTTNTALAGSLVEALSGSVTANTVTVDTTGLATGANLALGANSLTLTGGGGMTFSGANAYDISATGAGGITSTSGGALIFNNYNLSTVTFSAPILASGVNNVIFNGTGTTVLNKVSTYTGSTTLAGGTLTINGSGKLAGSGTYAGAIAISSGATLNVASTAAQTWSGAITGAGTLIQANSGALTLSGTGTAGLGANSVQVNNSSTLNYTGGTTNGATYSFTTGTVTVASGSTLSLVAREDNGYGGAAIYTVGSSLTLNGGSVRLGGDNGAFFQRIGNATSWSLSGSNTINNGNGNFGQYQAIEGSISGSGTLAISRGSALGSGRTINFKGSMAGYSGNVTVGTSADTVGAVTFGNSSGWGSGTLTLTGAGSNVLIGDRAATDLNSSWTGGSALSFTSGTLSPAGLITVGAGAELKLNNNSAFYAILLQTTGGLTVNGGTVSALGTAGTSAMVPNGTWTFGGSALSTVSANVRLNNAGTIFSVADAVAGTGVDTTISGVISGTNGFAKTEAGTLTLSGANSYSGATTIGAGTLSIAADNHLGTAPGTATPGRLVINGGTFAASGSFALNNNRGIAIGPNTGTGTGTMDVASGQTLTYGGILANNGGTGGLIKTGTGTLLLSGSGSWTGATAVNAGTLEVLAKTNDVAYTVASGATLKIGYTTGGGYANTNIKVTGDGVAATTGLYLSGGTSYNASGQIELITGPTTIRQYGTGLASIGMFDINGNALSTTAAASGSVIDSSVQFVSRGFGMSVNISSGSATATGDLVMNGSLNVGDLGFYKRGGGSLLLNGAGSATNAAVKIEGGSVIIGISNALGTSADLAISSGARLVVNGFSQGFRDLVGAGGIVGSSATLATLSPNQATAQTFSGVIGGAGTNDNNLALTKGGTATLTLSGNNTYTGDTTISVGAIKIQNANALGSTAAGTTVSFGAQLQIQGGITTAAEALSLSGAGISSDGALRNISGNNTFTGAITLATPTRIQSDAGTLTLSGAVTSGAALLTVGGAGDTAISGSIGAGAGGLTKDGSGTVTLSGSNEFSGDTTIAGGTLTVGVDGALGNTGKVTVNAGGTLLLSGTSTNRINDSATITLAGGTIAFSGDATEGTLPGTGALTLTADSVIDFGGGNNVINFGASDLADWTANKVLSIYNWSGSTGGGGNDRLIFGSASGSLTGDQLGQIRFYDGGLGSNFLGGGGFVGSLGEVAPVPEPTSVFTVFGLFGLAALRERRNVRAALRAGRVS